MDTDSACKHMRVKADNGWACIDCGYRFPLGTRFRVTPDPSLRKSEVEYRYIDRSHENYSTFGGL